MAGDERVLVVGDLDVEAGGDVPAVYQGVEQVEADHVAEREPATLELPSGIQLDETGNPDSPPLELPYFTGKPRCIGASMMNMLRNSPLVVELYSPMFDHRLATVTAVGSPFDVDHVTLR